MENPNAYERIKLQSEQLLQVGKIKRDFYTKVSHEFRTPLSLIQGSVQELITSGKQSASDIQLFSVVKRNSQLILNLVEQIIELSKIDGGAMKVNPTSGFYFPMLASNEKRGLFHTTRRAPREPVCRQAGLLRGS